MATDTHSAAKFEAMLDEWRAINLDVENSSDESEWERLLDARATVEKRIYATPAPDIAAVLAKLEIAAGIGDGAGDASAADLLAIMADLRRFAGVESAVTFQPDLWLARWTKAEGGYFVRDDGVHLHQPISGTGPRSKSLLKRLDEANGRNALADHIRAMQPLEAAL